jgi:hypothetical protein
MMRRVVPAAVGVVLLALGAFGSAALADPGKHEPPPSCAKDNPSSAHNPNCGGDPGGPDHGVDPLDTEERADNCPGTWNPSQSDLDGDGTGDACELDDTDGDLVRDQDDNCPATPNTSQADTDGDGAGDDCDTDDDNDGVGDGGDNCPTTYNRDQFNSDGGPNGDACDRYPDRDHDGVADPAEDEVENSGEFVGATVRGAVSTGASAVEGVLDTAGL